MTATCPPDLEREILRTLRIKRYRSVRAPTPRPEISYNVHVVNNEPAAVVWLMDRVEHARDSYRPGEKGLVFCRSHETTEKLASLLGCASFHRDERTNSQIRDIYDEFVGDDAQKIIVATSLLGAGVDIAHVRNVWHFGTPWSMIDYVQETGRGGRDGEPAFSHVVTWKADLDRISPEPNYTEDVLRQWLVQQSGCRRTPIAQILDRKPTSCILLRDSHLCDLCQRALAEPRPQPGVGLFRDPRLTDPARVPAPPQSPAPLQSPAPTQLPARPKPSARPKLPQTSSSFELLPTRPTDP